MSYYFAVFSAVALGVALIFQIIAVPTLGWYKVEFNNKGMKRGSHDGYDRDGWYDGYSPDIKVTMGLFQKCTDSSDRGYDLGCHGYDDWDRSYDRDGYGNKGSYDRDGYGNKGSYDRDGYGNQGPYDRDRYGDKGYYDGKNKDRRRGGVPDWLVAVQALEIVAIFLLLVATIIVLLYACSAWCRWYHFFCARSNIAAIVAGFLAIIGAAFIISGLIIWGAKAEELEDLARRGNEYGQNWEARLDYSFFFALIGAILAIVGGALAFLIRDYRHHHHHDHHDHHDHGGHHNHHGHGHGLVTGFGYGYPYGYGGSDHGHYYGGRRYLSYQPTPALEYPYSSAVQVYNQRRYQPQYYGSALGGYGSSTYGGYGYAKSSPLSQYGYGYGKGSQLSQYGYGYGKGSQLAQLPVYGSYT